MMRKRIQICAWFCALAFVVAAGRAQAVGNNNAVSYVSNSGSDDNNCSNPTTLACSSFDHALSETLPFGEIDCVNAGMYGSAAITQSVTIDCAGGFGGTVGAIDVNGSGIVVTLRNLTIINNGFGLIGIDGENMATLYIDNCFVLGYADFGIEFEPSSNAQLFVSNSLLSYNGGSGASGGIYIKPASGVTATVSIDRSQIVDNYFGIYGDGTAGGIIKGTISDSVVTGTTEDGIVALSSGPGVWLFIDRTKVAENAYGLAAGGSGAEILANNTSVFGNTTGLHTSKGGALYSYGNNRINGNTTNGAFTGMIGLQ
jgi:hypothetical protein